MLRLKKTVHVHFIQLNFLLVVIITTASFYLYFINMLHKDSEEARRQLMAHSGEDDGMYFSLL